jgi:hypothetical protein
MKEKKVSLGADGKLVDHSLQAECLTNVVAGEWDDWMQNFDDDDDFMGIEDSDEPQFQTKCPEDYTVDSFSE